MMGVGDNITQTNCFKTSFHEILQRPIKPMVLRSTFFKSPIRKNIQLEQLTT